MKIDGSKLKFQRSIHHLSQKNLSQKSGLSICTIINALHGKDVRPMTARLLSRAIGIETEKILEEENQ